MRLEADALRLIADLRRTLAGSSEGRGVERHAGTECGSRPVRTTRGFGPRFMAAQRSTSRGSADGYRAPNNPGTSNVPPSDSPLQTGCVPALTMEVGGTHPLSGRPSLEPTGCDDWHELYTARMAAALRKQAIRTARYKRKLWREAEAAREERRRGLKFGEAPDGVGPFEGFREGKSAADHK